jgi:chromosome segregation ATPase
VLLAAAGIALAAGAAFWAGRRLAAPDSSAGLLSKLEADNLDLRQRTEQLEREAAGLRSRLEERAAEQPPASQAPMPRDRAAVPETAETARQLAVVQQRLAAANTAIGEMRVRVLELETTLERVNAENKQLQSSGSEMKDRLEATARVVQAMEGELKAKSDRLLQLETAARKTREESAATTQRVNLLASTTRELEELNRRRENHLAGLQRRYRDLTDQYRSLAVRLDTQRDSPVPFVTDISRIQTAVQSAEDDLRQLNSLNAQAQRLAQRLAPR